MNKEQEAALVLAGTVIASIMVALFVNLLCFLINF